VCCVCLGNICRSPMAEVALRDQIGKAGLAGRVVVDSAGTGDWHVGDPMDRGARTQLERRGYDGSAHRARQIDTSWLAERDLLLAMDRSNLATLRLLARRVAAADAATPDTATPDTATPDTAEDAAPGTDRRIRLFGEVAGLDGAEVPDPYGDGPAAFARVLTMLEAGAANLAVELRAVAGTRL
jgi:low molecular weight protein-tyrosine phosphatase